MADQGGGNTIMRDYRKGNWTMSETMILIEAKKMDDERRMKRSTGGGGGGETSEGILIRSSSSSSSSTKPSEPRWKWVEDYCWKKGCYRSQNQCNDKWDNLMRDYKKVRDYERRVMQMGENSSSSSLLSYWKMERAERKEKNLPTNMLPQIYDALVEVVEKKSHQMQPSAVAGGGGGGAGIGVVSASASAPPLPITPHVGYLVERPTVTQQPAVSLPPHVPSPPLMMPQNVTTPVPPLLPSPPTVAAQPPLSHPTPCEDSESSEHSDSPAKRRRRRGGGEEGISGSINTSSNDVGNAISRSASIIAQALQACDEREEKRHRETLSLHERRLKLEESKTEINRQGINGLVDAINKLANSIHALASSSKNNLPPTN